MAKHPPLSSEQINAGAANWVTSFAPLSEQWRLGAEFATQVSTIVARASQMMAARQSAVIAEAVNDLAALMRSAAPNPNDPNAAARAYSAYVENVMRRGMAQLTFSVETAAEMSASALELAERRLAAHETGAGHAANSELSPGKK